MSEHTGIEWTDHTFNIAWGCMKVSPGCTLCYAEGASLRFGFNVWGPEKTTPRRTFDAGHWREPLRWNRKAIEDGVRRRVFCSSMCDVFEDHATIDAEREKLWPLIRATPALDWQILTKRPERIAALLPSDWGKGYLNVLLGTSAEDQERFDERIPALFAQPARRRFLSAEPLLGPITMCAPSNPYRLDWVIVGGESQPGCRPMLMAWAEQLVAECVSGAIPVFVKQLGGHPDKRGGEQALVNGIRHVEMPS